MTTVSRHYIGGSSSESDHDLRVDIIEVTPCPSSSLTDVVQGRVGHSDPFGSDLIGAAYLPADAILTADDKPILAAEDVQVGRRPDGSLWCDRRSLKWRQPGWLGR